MSKSLGLLTLDLVAEVGRFTSGLDKASRNADKNSKDIQQSIQSIDDKLSLVGSNIKKFAAVLGVGLSANAFVGWVDGAMQAAASTATFASRIDVAVEDLTAMRFVAAQTGVSIDSFDGSMMRLTRRLGAAKNEGGPAITTLKRLGLSAEALLKLPLDERLKAIGASMQKLDTQAERLTAAQDLAGDSARQLVPMFMMQAEEIDNAREMAEKLGYVYTTDFAQSADTLLTQMDNIKGAFGNLALGIAEDILPTLEKFVNSISSEDIENALNGIKVGFDIVITSSKALAIILLGRLAGSLAASSLAFIKARYEVYQYQKALAKMAGISRGAAIGITAMGVTARGASIAMATLGGPVGILAIAASSLALFGSSAKGAGVNLDELDAKIYGLTQRIGAFTKNQAISQKNSFHDDIRELEKELKALEEDLIRADDAVETLRNRLSTEKLSVGHYDAVTTKLKEWERKQDDVRGKIDDTTGSIGKATDAISLLDGHLKKLGDTSNQSIDDVMDRFDEMTSKLRDEIGRVGLKGNVAVFEYELKNTDKYADLNPTQIEELRLLNEQKDVKLENLRLSNQTNTSRSKGIDIASEHKRIMESTLSDEERRGIELSKNLDILKQYGASEADMIAVRRAAFESMSISMPGMGEGGDTLTAQLARIHENMTQLDTWREEQLAKLELAYGNEESALAESLARREEIEQDYRMRRSQFEGEMNQELLNLGVNLSNDSLDALRQAGMESSGIYKAMFLANKASAFANAIISANEAGAKAMAAYPNPVMGMSVGAMVKGIGLANAGVIAATGLKGMAHSGLDKVPETGTWLLEKGERVVTSNTSAKLDATLESLRSQNAEGGGETVVSNVYITLNGEGDVSSRNEEGGSQLGKLMEAVTVKTMLKELKPGGILARR